MTTPTQVIGQTLSASRAMTTRARLLTERAGAIGLLLTMGLLLPVTSRAQIINGSFETGDLTGWTASSFRVFAVGSASPLGIPGPGDPGTWVPSQGSTFGWLFSGDFPGVYTTLSQTFSASAGDQLTFDTFFDAGDSLPYNDNGYVRLVNVADESDVMLYAKSVADVGNFGGDGWRSLSYVIPVDGMYRLEAGVTEGLDFQHHSAIGLDNVALVPEPSVLALLGAAAVMCAQHRVARRSTQGRERKSVLN